MYTREQELALWEDYVKNNNLLALKKLKMSLRPFLYSIVDGKINTDGSLDRAQILARLDAALPDLLKKYDPSKGQLNTFIKSHLDGITKNAVKENQLEAHVPRTEASQLSYLKDAMKSAEIEYGPNPTNRQILQFGPQLKDVQNIERTKRYFVRTNIGDASHGDSEDPLQFKDQFQTHGFSQNDLSVSLKMNEIKELLNTLNPSEKAIVEAYVFQGKNITDIALSLGVSSSQIRRILKTWQEKAKERGLG